MAGTGRENVRDASGFLGTSTLLALGRALAQRYETTMHTSLPEPVSALLDRILESDSYPTQCCVLVVESDPHVRAMAVALLEETDLFVLQSTSAEAALELMATKGERIAMLFTDIGLGGEMDGVMLSCTVREQWPHTLTVVTSGGAGERIRNLPPEAIFMPKPWLGLEVLLQAERASGRMKRKLSGEA